MKKASSTTKYFLYGIVTVIGLGIVGCLSLLRELKTVKPTYILAEQSPTEVEIWQLSSTNKWSKFYTVTRPADKPEDVILPTEEIERLEEYLANEPSAQNKPFSRSRMYYVLSPTRKQFAFVEWYSLHATPYQAGFFGVNYAGNVMLETNKTSIFFQSPSRIPTDRHDLFTSLKTPLLSPDGQYYAIEHRILHGHSTPLIINTNTGTIQKLEPIPQESKLLAWSPDSTMVFLNLYRSAFDSPGDLIRLCEIEPLNCRDIELDGIWIYAREANWSPYHNEIVFVGSIEDFHWASSPQSTFGLYLFDPETDMIQELLANVNSSLSNPRWSPNGRFVAVGYSNKGLLRSPDTILIIDRENQQIFAQIPVEGWISDWQWSQDNKAILLLPSYKTETSDLIKISISDGSKEHIELPAEINLKAHLGFDNLR